MQLRETKLMIVVLMDYDVSTGCVLINKNEPRKFNVSGVLLCVFLKKVFVGLSRFLIVICVQYTRNIHARYNSFCIIYA